MDHRCIPYTSQGEMMQVESCSGGQEEEGNSEEERVIHEEQNSNVDLENEINDGQNETEGDEEIQLAGVNKTIRGYWENARDNTKAAIKCEVKASIVSRAIGIKLQELCVKREEQEEEMQDLINQDKIINDYLRLEMTNRAPLLTELDKTDMIVNFLDEQIMRNAERYQQLKNRKEELGRRAESTISSYNKYKSERQRQSDEVNTKIQELTAAEANFRLDFENDVVRLKRELEEAESSLRKLQEENAETKRQMEENEKECDPEELTEIQEERERLNEKLDDLNVENLEQEEAMEEREQQTQLDLAEQDLKDVENAIADESRRLKIAREKVEENRSGNSINSERRGNIKASLEEYANKYTNGQEKIEEVKINYDATIQVVHTEMRDLEAKLSTTESDVAAVNKEKMDLSAKLAELRNESNEVSSSENKLKLQERQLKHELEESSSLLDKYDEQSKSFPPLDSLKVTYDKAVEKYSCETDEELQSLQEKKQLLSVELEETKEKYAATFKEHQEKLDVLMETTQKETVELQEKGERDLNDAQLQYTTATNALDTANAKYERLRQQYVATMQKRDALGRKQNVLSGKPKSQKRELPNFSRNQQHLVGILKNTGIRTPEKKVRFDPAGPSWETLSENSSESILNIWNNTFQTTGATDPQQGGLNSLFEDLRNSPPVREKSTSKNRSIFD